MEDFNLEQLLQLSGVNNDMPQVANETEAEYTMVNSQNLGVDVFVNGEDMQDAHVGHFDSEEEALAQFPMAKSINPNHDMQEEDIDLDNGYETQQQHDDLGAHGRDYFPNSMTSTAPKRLGPSAAKHGNNPMSAKQFAENTKKIHENLIYRYREYKKNT